ncbi:hypothetical protein ACFC09_10830 [Streptomyces sp. NPDC056161]|uniref:hypothetical protein n=1 Tax=Streptomyces sp. NPDC056161 TaxID=3345732 RepID=UPI0035DD7609
MIRLAPHEVLVGDSAAVAAALTRWRTDLTTLTGAHKEHRFRTLADHLDEWRSQGVDTSPFHSGLYLARNRYSEIGLRHMLPLDRVLVGASSTRPGAFGGFHHPNQGYRHLQMAALITMYGPLDRDVPADPDLAMLDLVRAHAHDCLHYGSARRYVLGENGQVVRTQYGINWRRPDGRTYSSSDPQDAAHTRNLGIIMEGACDRESRRLTRQVAELYDITGPDSPDDIGWWAYRDATGQLDDDEPAADAGKPFDGEAGTYAGSMARYQRSVNHRYEQWLAEVGAGEREGLQDLVLTAVISGDTGNLCRRLDDRHGPGTFAGMFRTSGYLTAPPQQTAACV